MADPPEVIKEGIGEEGEAEMEKRVTVKGGHHCSWSMVSKDMKSGSSASGKGSGKLGPMGAWIGRRLDPR